MKHEERKARAEIVFEAMANGESMRQGCIMAGISSAALMKWVAQDEEMREQYRVAREDLIDHMADELMQISDEPVGMDDNGRTDSGAVAKQKLQVDTRKWVLSKLAPKKYGDKVENTIVGDVEKPLVINFVEPPERDVD
jgi:hypothetical protein